MLQELHLAGVSTCVSSKAVRGRSLDLRASFRRSDDPVRGWHLEIGTERGGIPAFQETVDGADAVRVRLIAIAGDGARVVRSGRFPYARSHARTMELIARQAARWIEQEQEKQSTDSGCTSVPMPPAADPNVLERSLFIVAGVVRFVRWGVRYLFEEARWDVAVTSASIDTFLADPKNVWLHWLARSTSEFLADPFVAGHGDGRARVLCETVDAGVPSVVAIDLDDRFGSRKPMIASEDPTSYPYVFAVDDETWLLPEQHARRSLYAYRLNGKVEAIEEPIFHGIAAVDSTIVRHDGRWWLFCGDADDAPNYALRIYWANHPSGPWTPHARNPAKIDIAGSRPAGTFFVLDGTLYRPAQDCTGRYGRAVVVQRVEVLTPDDFQETPVARIDACSVQRAGAVGVHTLSHGEGWIAIDAQFRRWSLRKPFRLLRGTLA